MNDTNAYENTIGGTLGGLAGVKDVRKLAPGLWGFVHANGATLRGEARRVGRWLVLEAGLPKLCRGQGLDARVAWRLAARERELPGGCKFALTSEVPPSVRLRAEVLLSEEVQVAQRLAEALAGFGAAMEVARPRKKEEEEATAASAPATLKTDLARLCRESGWPFHEGEGADLRADLETAADDGFYQAHVTEEPGRGVCARAEVAAYDSPSEEVCHALGVLLLTANAALRLARATATEGERTRLGFEVVLPTPPSGAELAEVLACLSVACRHCGREAQAMDPELAKEYLAIRNLAS